MPRSESALPVELQDELDRLDAALAAVGSDGTGAPVATGAPPREDRPGVRPADDLDRELHQLVAAVRTARPALDPGTRMRLEDRARAAKRAPTRRDGLRLPTGRRGRLALALAATALVAVPAGLVVVAGDAGSGDDVVASSAVGSSTAGPTDRAGDGDAGASGDAAASAAPAAGASAGRLPAPTGTSRAGGLPAQTDGVLRSLTPMNRRAVPPVAPKAAPLSATRRVIRDVEQTVRIAPDGVARAAGRVTTIVADAGGYLDSSVVRERGADAGGRFEVVVPTGRLDTTVAALSRIGRPVKLERAASDVTDRATSLDDRLADLRADRDAARLQLARTVDPDRRAARRRELTLLSSRVAALRGQVVDLRRQTSTSRIDLQLTTSKASEDAVVPPPDDGPWGIGDAWHDAGRVLEVAGGGLLIGGVVLLPLLAVGGLGLVARRRGVARRQEATIDAA